jgi:hypothetical protein
VAGALLFACDGEYKEKPNGRSKYSERSTVELKSVEIETVENNFTVRKYDSKFLGFCESPKSFERIDKFHGDCVYG